MFGENIDCFMWVSLDPTLVLAPKKLTLEIQGLILL